MKVADCENLEAFSYFLLKYIEGKRFWTGGIWCDLNTIILGQILCNIHTKERCKRLKEKYKQRYNINKYLKDYNWKTGEEE